MEALSLFIAVVVIGVVAVLYMKRGDKKSKAPGTKPKPEAPRPKSQTK